MIAGHRRILKPLLVLAFLATASCREEPLANDAGTPTPVFVISIDTLRSDRLPVYGYESGRTPAIDAFREDSVLFRRAYANVPVTLPSHASIFTGQLPHRHGVRDNIGYSLRADTPTLASILRARGYQTGAAVSSFVLRRDTGIAAGFDFFDDSTPLVAGETISSMQRDGDQARMALQRWLDRSDDELSLGFLHLYEPHYPYSPGEPFASEIPDPYDGEIAKADAIVGRFLDDLRRRDLYDSSLIIILSDHGEGLGDHGELEHGVFLYREAIQVPLLIKLPGNRMAGEERTDPVALVDVTPTILALLDVPAPGPMDGVDVFETQQARVIFSESFYPRLHYGWSELYSAIGSRFHLIDAPSVELFDLDADPAESENLAESQRRIVAEMRQKIAPIIESHPFEAPLPVDPEALARLESLGYLGGADTQSGARPDPKDKIDLLTRFGEGTAALQRGDLKSAGEVARSIVTMDPAFLPAWGLLSSAHRQAGNITEAVRALEEQMRRSPGNPQTALAIAALLLDLRRYEEARANAEIALAHAPSLAWESIGTIELARGNLDEAENAASRAGSFAPMRVQPLLIRSEIRRAREDSIGELQLIDDVRSRIARGEASPLHGIELRRGDALLRLRRVGEAEAAFRAETGQFPSNHRAWANLALVIDAQGRREEARRVLDRALELNPSEAMRRAARDVNAIISEAGGRVVPTNRGVSP
ncbi:MAG TPA: sulfatase-like hydrolase/transferase [Thermoanaerobaculia bacterium]|nr:sulfatase-like hydrolase/transferase [Thermoanaerobaculia bacterium]